MSGRPKTDLGARLRRVLLMIPWLLEEGGSTVAEIARRFETTEKEVIRDLTLVMCCGLPPYGGGDLITIVLDDDGTVEAWPGPFFTRPMQLTPREGFAVLAAGRALEAVPGTAQRGALASALAKLEAALGASGTLAVDLEAPPHLATVQRAATAGERLQVTYYSAWRDDVTERVVEPLVVHSRDGRWYAETRDVTDPAAGPRERRLRVDRIRSAEPTGETFEVPPTPPAPPERLYVPGPDAVEVTVLLPPTASWFADWMETESVEELDDGRLRVRLFVEGEKVLERLLLRVGPEAVVE
ncbi:MAG TPA: WYL domain-containing protein, partial [Actinomycetota bacterium]|nr:WYL domain-containing protein [Actinomycetota bacterium]